MEIIAGEGRLIRKCKEALNPDQVLLQQSPLALPKSLKNSVEMEGLKNAHIHDGAAIVQYFAWLDKQMQEIYGASGYFKELESQNSKKQFYSFLNSSVRFRIIFNVSERL